MFIFFLLKDKPRTVKCTIFLKFFDHVMETDYPQGFSRYHQFISGMELLWKFFWQNFSEDPENLSVWNKLSKIMTQAAVIPVY